MMSLLVIVCCFFLLFQKKHCLVIYNITSSTPLLADQTLLSSNQAFEFGFFTPNEASGNQYVGIRFKNLSQPKIVWVANREKPVSSYNTEPASIRVETDGNLKLVDGQKNTVWSTDITILSNNSFVQLLDTGNLVLKDINLDILLWQSFDYPCDTVLPGMRIGINTETGEKKYLASWKSDTDPSPGDFVFGITPEIPPQIITWKGSLRYWRAGQWDKTKFLAEKPVMGRYGVVLTVQQDLQGTYVVTMQGNPETSTWIMFLSPKGQAKVLQRGYNKTIEQKWEQPNSSCLYGTCGPFGICSAFSSPICSCLKGFVPNSFEEWNRGNWTGGCRRKTTLNCERGMRNSSSEDVFWKASAIKLPDFAKVVPDPSTEQQCWKLCLSNCSCQAYSFINSIGCIIWIEPLVDMEKITSSDRDLFIRLALIDSGGAKQTRKLIISVTAVASVFMVVLVAYILCKNRAEQKTRQSSSQNHFATKNVIDKKGKPQQVRMWRQQLECDDEFELPLFRLTTILVATNNFDVMQKLGQGGFGPVYRVTTLKQCVLSLINCLATLI